MPRAETGESTASIIRRRDDENMEKVRAALAEGAHLVRPAKLDNYYVWRNGEFESGCLSPRRVAQLEAAGEIEHVGVHRYALRRTA